MIRRRRALLSVSDKTGIQELGLALSDRGFEILSTGGTARELRAAQLDVTDVATVTGHPEIMEGRVKTLHPAIHGPLLARRDVPGDMDALDAHGYQPIDLVAVNLYPFREAIARGDVSVAAAMKQVDIGGPTMIRAAAKNHAHVWVVVDPDDYARVVDALDDNGGADPLRKELAGKVFRHISEYDAAIAEFLSGAGSATAAGGTDPLPEALSLSLGRISSLRYGENPDQAASFYAPEGQAVHGIASLPQHHGKELSYNNLLDLDGALLSLSPFALSLRPVVCIIKHTTPCGIGLGDSVESAFRLALRTDPLSAFGSVISTNRPVDKEAATALSELFIECVVAPEFTEEAMEILTGKKNLRILTFPEYDGEFPPKILPLTTMETFDRELEGSPGPIRTARFLAAHGWDPGPQVLRGIHGGILAQTAPLPPFFGVADVNWKVATKRTPTEGEADDLAFAWAAVFGVKSNAILLAKGGATLGIGAGQMSRVDASRLSVQKAHDAGLDLQGCALASDAFFPFADGVEAAASAGVKAIIQPGGSIRDEQVVAAADTAGIAMVFTGRRLFRH